MKIRKANKNEREKIEGINDLFTLRGMYVANRCQKKGYGSMLLNHIESTCKGKAIYCLPFSHLEHFYGKIGFNKISKNELPNLLKDRAIKYRSQGHDIIAMKRRAE